MRRLLLTLTILLTPALAHAGGYGQMISGSAQAGLATPQAALMSPQAAVDSYPSAALAAPAYGTCGAAAALQSYVPQQQVIAVQRQIVAQPVYVQQAPVVVQRQVYAAPVVQQAIVSPYVQAQANVGYGVGTQRGLVVNRGLIGLRRFPTEQPTKSKAVVKTGRGLFRRR
jgi:hypothetical protein